MILKADQQNAQIPAPSQQARGATGTSWRVCGLTEWFKRETNALERDVTGQSFDGDLSFSPLLFPQVFGQ